MMKLEHVAITVSNDKELDNFYHDIFGFELIKKFELNKELSEKIFGISEITPVCLIQKEDLTLEIFISTKISTPKYNHICISIENREEIYKKAVEKDYDCICIKRDRSDLIFIKDSKCYVVGIKSGPYWGNSDQINRMKRNFKKARHTLKKEGTRNRIVCVNGCMYGKDNKPYKKDKKDREQNYYKYCGQEFWYLISGNKQLYKDIIKPLDKQVKKRDERFQNLYGQKVNQLTQEFLLEFCDNGIINWNKLIEFVSKKSN